MPTDDEWRAAMALARKHRFWLRTTSKGEYRVCLVEDERRGIGERWGAVYRKDLDAAVYRGMCMREDRDVFGR